MEADYRCPKSGFTNSDITIFAILDGAVDLDIKRKTTDVQEIFKKI